MFPQSELAMHEQSSSLRQSLSKLFLFHTEVNVQEMRVVILGLVLGDCLDDRQHLFSLEELSWASGGGTEVVDVEVRRA
jgi:hypothetical protein